LQVALHRNAAALPDPREMRALSGGTRLAIRRAHAAPAEAPGDKEVGMRRFRRAAVGFLCGLVLLGTGVMAAPSGSEMGGGKINVNTASVAELASLPGIGPAKAQAIVDHRAKEPFTRAEDLRKVKGIGPKLYDAIREQITVGDAPAPSGRGG